MLEVRNVSKGFRGYILLAPALAVAVFALSALAQSTVPTTADKPLAFEAVSIRENHSGGAQSFGPTPDGYRLRNLFFQMPIMTAYVPQTGGSAHYAPDQVVALPDWVLNDRYDIDAKIPEANLADWQDSAKQRAMLREMLQNMLRDRLKLTVHRATTRVPVYFLTVAKGDPNFKETDPTIPHPGGIPHPQGGVTVSERHDGQMTGHCYGCSMSLLAWFLSGDFTGRPVQDKTGLSGSYDFWLPRPAPVDGGSTDSGQSAYSIVDDLGLKLVPGDGQVETLVIDHVEKPSEN